MPQHSVPARRRRRALIVALLGAAVILVSGCSAATSTPAAPPTTDPTAQGSSLVNEFFTILQQPDAAKADRLKAFLAPEFQVVRDTGDQLTKDAYLLKNPIVATFTITSVVGTQGGGVLVVSYRIATSETINGVAQTTTAPRLSVFRWLDGAWRLSAHSNFGALPK